MEDDAFHKPKTQEEIFKDTIEFLEETRFNFACFCDSTKRYLIKLEEERKKEVKKSGKKSK